MTVIALPDGLRIAKQTWCQERNDIEFRNSFGAQALEVSTPLWSSMITATQYLERDSGIWQALMMQLRGRTNQLSLHNTARPAPLGTMRGTMTLNLAAAQGDTSLSITGGAGEAATTLLKGDLLGLGTGLTQQVVMIVADATADGSGVISVTVEPALRNAHLIAAVVTWDKPKVLFRRRDSRAMWEYENIKAAGFALDMLEDVRP